jgi:hypothetical protein
MILPFWKQVVLYIKRKAAIVRRFINLVTGL